MFTPVCRLCYTHRYCWRSRAPIMCRYITVNYNSGMITMCMVPWPHLSPWYKICTYTHCVYYMCVHKRTAITWNLHIIIWMSSAEAAAPAPPKTTAKQRRDGVWKITDNSTIHFVHKRVKPEAYERWEKKTPWSSWRCDVYRHPAQLYNAYNMYTERTTFRHSNAPASVGALCRRSAVKNWFMYNVITRKIEKRGRNNCA